MKRGAGRGRGQSMFGGRGRGRGRSTPNRAAIECFKCQKLEHYLSKCLDWERRANFVEMEEKDELLLMHDIC